MVIGPSVGTRAETLHRWRVLAVVTLGSLMGSIDSTVLIIAFPQIARDLHASLVAMVWVIIIYILIGTALVLSFGRVADMIGRKKLYTSGFVIFVLGSALCGIAQSAAGLILFRGVQGVGGALLLANSFAILSDAFPPRERGRAFGVNSVVWASGSVLGVVLGGLVLTFTSWRWIFWINVPIGIAATVLVLMVVPESETPTSKGTFDFPAAILFTTGLALSLLGVTEGILNGWGDVTSLAPISAAVPAFLLFVVWEWKISRDPILPLELFRSWLFSASLVALVLQGLALFATNFVLMVYFQGIREVSVLSAAYLLVPLSAALAVVGPLGGRLSDRYGARVLSTVGLVTQGSALFLFSTINGQTPLWTVALFEALLGAGGGLFYPANTAAIMGGVPRNRYGVAAGVLMTVRNSSTALSFAVALAALTTQLPAGTGATFFGGAFTPQTFAHLHLTSDQFQSNFLNGMHLAFRLSAGLMWAGAVFSALRGRESRSPHATFEDRAFSRAAGEVVPAGRPLGGPASALGPDEGL